MSSPVTRFAGIALCLIFLTFNITPAAAQDCPDLTGQPHLLGTADGFNHLAATPVGKGLVAAITSDSILVVYRQQPDAAPVPMASVALQGDYRWIASLGKFAYVAGDTGVKVFKIGKDGSIQFKGPLEGFEPAGQIKADGERLAVIHEGAWSLWDCSDRATPVRLARVVFETHSYSYNNSRIALGGNRVAIDGTVFDISRPKEPAVAGHVPTGNSTIAGCEIVGDRLYDFRTWSEDGGSWIFGDRWWYRTYQIYVRDLNDTAEFPVLAVHRLRYSTAWPLRAPRTVITRNGSLVLAGQTDDPNTLVIDTEAPVDAEPTWVPVLPSLSLVHQDDQLVGLGDGVWAFAVPTTSQTGRVPVAPADLGGSGYGTGYVSYSMNDIDVAGGLVAVSQFVFESDGRHYWDESIYAHLYQPGLGSLEPVATINTWHERIALIDGFLLLGAYHLDAIDISDPTAPGEPVRVPGIEDLRELVSLDGRTIAVGDRKGGFTIYDMTDIGAPMPLGSCQLGAGVGSMTRDGDLVLVTIPTSDVIKGVDVSDRAAPLVSGIIEVPGPIQGLAVHEGRALALTTIDRERYQIDFDYSLQGYLAVLDQDALEVPKMVSTKKLPMYVNGVASHGQSMFMSGGGLHAYDQSGQVFIGSIATTHRFLGIASCQERLYAVCFNELVDLTDISCTLVQGEGIGGVAHVGIPGAALALTASPNPFNPMTRFAFTLASDQPIELAVYDLRGRRVRELVHESWTTGRHVIDWNGRDDLGREMSSGVYFARLQAGPESAVIKVMLVR